MDNVCCNLCTAGGACAFDTLKQGASLVLMDWTEVSMCDLYATIIEMSKYIKYRMPDLVYVAFARHIGTSWAHGIQGTECFQCKYICQQAA